MEKEKVVLVGVYQKRRDLRAEEAALEELTRMAETAGASVAAVLTQRIDRFNPRTLIGPGKVAEVAQTAQSVQARTVIFDENLSPSQQLHLEKEIGAKIVDRTRLILDIFAQRARTKEGELQVELAQLAYMLPRLTGSWRAFSQQVGGIGTRGPGEHQLEYERRHIQYRLEHLKKGIERLKEERLTQRRRRESVPVPSVAIIGYTNAGKSSMLNSLMAASDTKPGVYADDKLFATLDPTTRRVRLPEGGWSVFTDTVGFISKLPTGLIAAFRSTLEEVSRADCLLHLEDGLAPYPAEQRRIVSKVLEELGAADIPRLTAVNKVDLLAEDQRARLRAEDPGRLLVSAKTGEGSPELLARLQDLLGQRWLCREIQLAPGQNGHLGEIYRCSQVIRQSTRKGKTHLKLRVTRENWSRLMSKIKPA